MPRNRKSRHPAVGSAWLVWLAIAFLPRPAHAADALPDAARAASYGPRRAGHHGRHSGPVRASGFHAGDARSDSRGSDAMRPGPPKWSIALAGGVARGLAYAGVFRALDEQGLRPI